MPPGAKRALGICALTTLLVTVESTWLPEDWSATVVGFTFLAVTYQIAISRDSDETVRHYGLSFGGLLESVPLSLKRLILSSATALGVALALALIVFPAYALGFFAFFRPQGGFVFHPWSSFVNDALGQILVVALPEEAFYRGYFQTALDDVWPQRIRLLGGYLSAGVVVSSVLFAVGHWLTEPNPARLAVFFPSLLFGWLRTRTRSVGPSVAFHALCNLFSAYLGRGFGLWP